MATSIFQRKRDLVYLIFFIIHIPVMLGKLLWRLIISSLEKLHFSTNIAPVPTKTSICQDAIPNIFLPYLSITLLISRPTSFNLAASIRRFNKISLLALHQAM
jgi:hypothetical protein